MTTRSGAGGTICSGSLETGTLSRLQGQTTLIGASTLLAEVLRPFLSPDADDADGGWTTELGGTTLFPSIDELMPDDSDYIQSTDGPVADICRFRLTDPATTLAMPAAVRVRAARSGAGITHLITRLKEGTTLIAEWEEENIPASLTTFNFDVLQAEFDAIGDQTNLFIELQADFTALEAETTTWVAAVVTNGGTVSDARLVLVNSLIGGLKTDGIWTKLDRLWLFAAENTGSALTDLVAVNLASAVGGPTFTTDRGYSNPAVANSININSGFSPTTAPTPKFTQNSASLFAWNCTAATAGTICGSDAACRIDPYASGIASWRITEGTTDTIAVADSLGLYHVNRTGAATAQLYKNGSEIDTNTTASVAPTNVNFVFGTTGGGLLPLNGGTISCGGFGQSLDATEADALYDRLRTYMTAVGVP